MACRNAGPLAEHNRALIVAYRLRVTSRERQMRLFMGIIVGCALTIGGAYVSDAMSASPDGAHRMVNWDVVAKNLSGLTDLARDGWKKITG